MARELTSYPFSFGTIRRELGKSGNGTRTQFSLATTIRTRLSAAFTEVGIIPCHVMEFNEGNPKTHTPTARVIHPELSLRLSAGRPAKGFGGIHCCVCFLSVTRKSFLGRPPSSNSSMLTISKPFAR